MNEDMKEEVQEDVKEVITIETKQEEKQSQYDEVQLEKKVERVDSYFDGKVLELIGYRILAIIITVFTLGIASAWAEKLLIAYKVEHTVYNGKRLKFEGTGASLFVQRFKWIFLSIITLGIYAFWIPIKKQKWITSNIHFEKEEFNKEDSYFDGGLLGLIGVNLFCNIISIFSLGLLLPFGICYKQKWIIKHTIINRKRIVFNGKALSLIGHYLLWWFLSVITFGIFLLWLPIKIENWKAKNTHIKLKDEAEQKVSAIPGIIGFVLLVALIVLICAGFTSSNSNTIISSDSDFNIGNIFEDLEVNDGLSSMFLEKNKDKVISEATVKSINKTNSSSKKNNTNSTKSNSNSSSKSNTSTVSSSQYKRSTKLTLVDGVLCYGYSDHSKDLVAEIIGSDIIISSGSNKSTIKNANAKYMYYVAKIAADEINLYYITNNNELYVIYGPSATGTNQKVKVKSSVAEFLGKGDSDSGAYIKVLLTDGSTSKITYLKYNY